MGSEVTEASLTSTSFCKQVAYGRQPKEGRKCYLARNLPSPDQRLRPRAVVRPDSLVELSRWSRQTHFAGFRTVCTR
jgi:hypothetical protein